MPVKEIKALTGNEQYGSDHDDHGNKELVGPDPAPARYPHPS
jgi:hypothetical protein